MKLVINGGSYGYGTLKSISCLIFSQSIREIGNNFWGKIREGELTWPWLHQYSITLTQVYTKLFIKERKQSHMSISDGCTRCSSQCTLARSEKGHVTSCTPPGCHKMEVTLEHFFHFLRRLEEVADERKKGSYH
ncbi:hypothetical protein OUZ56_000784 [Daphnia magna]|uniref:Uncharacterized protein n=1 Tax=Daphnia magna TaxID=35525 RepID=A0ABR0A0Q7_9CRUS|nr:hypothetical protein OUZ56_000784 [Daphnia magna]